MSFEYKLEGTERFVLEAELHTKGAVSIRNSKEVCAAGEAGRTLVNEVREIGGTGEYMRQDLVSPYQDGGGLPLSEAEMHWRVFEQKNEILFLDLQMFTCAVLLTTDCGRKGGNNRTRKPS